MEIDAGLSYELMELQGTYLWNGKHLSPCQIYGLQIECKGLLFCHLACF